MRSGQMRQRIEIALQKANASPTDGEDTYTFTKIGKDAEADPPVASIKIPAAVRNVTRKITDNAGVTMPLGEEVYEFKIRYRPETIKIGDQITYRSELYKIVSIEDPTEKQHELIIRAEVTNL